MLNIHGPTIREETITALRLQKDFIVRSEGLSNVVVTKSLIRDYQNSHALYTVLRLEEAWQKELAAADAKRREEEQQKAAKLEVLDNDLMVIERGIKIAEAAIKEGVDELEGLLQQGCLDREAIVSAHNKILMGIKRKIDLENALKIIKEKHKKVWMIGYGHAGGFLYFIVIVCYSHLFIIGCWYSFWRQKIFLQDIQLFK